MIILEKEAVGEEKIIFESLLSTDNLIHVVFLFTLMISDLQL